MELKLRGFSINTIKSYIMSNNLFLKWIKKQPEDMEEDDVKNYLAHLISDKNMAASSIALKKAALKFLYDEVLKKDIVNLKTPKIPKHIPVVLTKEEIRDLIDSAGSYKTKVIIKFLYTF